MKKFLSLVLAAVILFIPVFASAADSISARVDEYGISLDFPRPEGWHLFTLDMPEDDPQFAEVGMTYEQIIDGFKDNHIYYNSANPEMTKEYTLNVEVTSKTESLHNYNLVDDAKLAKLAQKVVDTDYSRNLKGLSYTGYEIFKGEPATWILFYGRIEMEVEGRTDPYISNILDFNTVVNGVNIHLTYHSTEDITESEEAVLKAAADSMRWDEIKERDIANTGVGKQALIGGGLALVLILLLIPHIKSYKKKKQQKLDERIEMAEKAAQAAAQREANRKSFLKEMGIEEEAKEPEEPEQDEEEEPAEQDDIGEKTE